MLRGGVATRVLPSRAGSGPAQPAGAPTRARIGCAGSAASPRTRQFLQGSRQRLHRSDHAEQQARVQLQYPRPSRCQQPPPPPQRCRLPRQARRRSAFQQLLLLQSKPTPAHRCARLPLWFLLRRHRTMCCYSRSADSARRRGKSQSHRPSSRSRLPTSLGYHQAHRRALLRLLRRRSRSPARSC